MVQCTVLQKNGSVLTIDIKNSDINNCSYCKYLKKKKELSELCQWNYNNFIIKLYGLNEGIAGQENKHELPPPNDTQLYFGDLLAIKVKNNVAHNFTEKDYRAFYDKAYGGFEDLENISDSDDFSQNESEDEDYIPGSESEEESDSISFCSDENSDTD
tara:strand:- start:487 stop:960 length:474 start_codon:yes stop_codon:yes gene_type:complete